MYRLYLLNNLTSITVNYFLSVFSKRFSKTRLLNSTLANRKEYKLDNTNLLFKTRYKKFKLITTIIANNTANSNALKSLKFIHKESKDNLNSTSSFNSYLYVIRYHSGCRPERSIYKKSLRRFLRNTWLSTYKRGRVSLLDQLQLSHNPMSSTSYSNAKYKNIIKYPSIAYNKFKRIRRVRNRPRKGNLKRSTFNTLMKNSNSFKYIYFKSKSSKRSLFSKKLFKAIKLGRGTFRLINQIRSKGKNRLIKAVKSLNHSTFYNRILNFELSTLSILLKSSFVWSLNDAKYIITNGYIFVDGNAVRNPKQVLSEGSRMQLPINPITYNWLSNKKKSLRKGYKKANRLRWYKSRVKSSRFRRRSYHFPKWLFKYSMVGSKAPSILEVDYTVLSTVLLYRPVSFNELNSPLWYYINLHAYSTYLWKYIN